MNTLTVFNPRGFWRLALSPISRLFQGSLYEKFLMLGVMAFAGMFTYAVLSFAHPDVYALTGFILPKVLVMLSLGLTFAFGTVAPKPTVAPAGDLRRGLGVIMSNRYVFGLILAVAYAADYYFNDDSLVRVLPNLAAMDRWIPVLSDITGRYFNFITIALWILMQAAELAGFQWFRAWIAVFYLQKKNGYSKYNWSGIKSQLMQSVWVGVVFIIAVGYDWVNLLVGIYGTKGPGDLASGVVTSAELSWLILIFSNAWLGIAVPIFLILGQEGLIFLGESLSETFSTLSNFDEIVVEQNAEAGIAVSKPAGRTLTQVKYFYAHGFAWPGFHPTSTQMSDVGDEGLVDISTAVAAQLRQQGWIRINAGETVFPDWVNDHYAKPVPAAA